MTKSEQILHSTKELSSALSKLRFSLPVTNVYNPLEYAYEPYSVYINKYATDKKRIIFLGMNPGPFGMAQTGIPFGEVNFVKSWLKISGKVARPQNEHSKRPIQGFSCSRSEISGKRFWGTISKYFATPEKFFSAHFVANYCPLVFMEISGRNITPDKLKPSEKAELFRLCDKNLKQTVEILNPDRVIGIGAFAETRAKEALIGKSIKIGKILHPSPASPLANLNWEATVLKELANQEIFWKKP